MSAERIVRIAMLAYPTDVRHSRGMEMRDTALDTSQGSAVRALGEGIGLLGAGLRARANVAAEAGTRRLVATACAQAVTVYGLVVLIPLLHFFRFAAETQGTLTEESAGIVHVALLAIAIAAALIGYDRVAGGFGLAWIGVSLQSLLGGPAFAGGEPRTAHWIALVVVPLACYLWMLIAPRRRTRNTWRLLWLAGAVLLGLFAPEGLGYAGFGLGLQGLILFALLPVGLLLLAAGPSLPLAFSLVLIAHGLSIWTFLSVQDMSTAQWAITTAWPVALASGAALTLISARRRVAS